MSHTFEVASGVAGSVESQTTKDPATGAKKKHKKRDRLRAAWIAFVGRILAQFIGAAASVVLGLLVVRTYTARVDQAGVDRVADRTTASRQATRATAQDVPGRPTVAVLPLQDFSAGTSSGAFAESLTEVLIADPYTVNPDQFESVYGNMPRFGLAAATEHVQATGRGEPARRRLAVNQTGEPALETF